MSKATIRAKERYWLEPNNIETQEKYAAYVEGYQQAEKDLEMTVDDIMKLDALLIEMWNRPANEDKYQEVLKRFNKERKEK